MSTIIQLIAVLISLFTFIVCLYLIGRTIQRGLQGLGRNPLAKKIIFRGMFISLLVILIVMSMAFGISYILFTANPPVEHSRIGSIAPQSSSAPAATDLNIHTTSCFTVALPFETINPILTKTNESCTLNVSITNSRGQFTLTHHLSPHTSFNEHPSIKMRQKYSDKYQLVNFDFPSHPEMLVFRTNQEIVFFISGPNNTVYEVAFHEISADLASQLTPEVYSQILTSISLPPPNLTSDFITPILSPTPSN